MKRAFDPSTLVEDVLFFDVRSHVDKLLPGSFATLSYFSRIVAENLLRNSTDADAAEASLRALIERRKDVDIPFHPARVVLQDLLGTPALVDLAGLRDAVWEAGGDPKTVNPRVPTLLVVDHSVNVDFDGGVKGALVLNMAEERRKNAERFEFLDWCRFAFSNLDVLMPGAGILHQINIERVSPVIAIDEGVAFPDSLVGTDSHTTMINALGVVGWGVGGLEAESVMLGHGCWMRLPEIVRVDLEGAVPAGVSATDVVLTLTEFLRREKVVGSVLEFHGAGVQALSLTDRATISNMAPEFGATAALFPMDEQTLRYLSLTGRAPESVRLVEDYARAQGLWADAFAHAHFDRRLSFDLAAVELCIAGPSDPHQRRPLSTLKAQGIATQDAAQTGDAIPDGAVVIAAITSCTNTSNPRSLIAAGLLAKKAVARGLHRKHWVKTSFAPGSRAAESYLAEAGLLGPLEQLGFGIVGFGCTSCNGMSGPLPQAVEAEIVERKLAATAVLSGNRNFDGRIHPRVSHAYLASPALVVAYAIAGSINVDIAHAVIGLDEEGESVRLDDLWPTAAEIDQALQSVETRHFTGAYETLFARPAERESGAGEASGRYPWRENSTYIRRPPYWDSQFMKPLAFANLRPLAILGDNVTTDHLSPSGAILAESAAGEFLMSRGVDPLNFNSYGTRRGNHEVAVRATFANGRLNNEMAGRAGSLARLQPDGVVMRLFEAAEAYAERGQPLIVVAGRNYGAGSSRDWAAKGLRLLGVQAVICEGFERIHRTNLIAVGILPLEFAPGTTRHTLDLDGSERFDVAACAETLRPGAQLKVRIHRRDGRVVEAMAACRIDTQEELSIFNAGGLLPRLKEEYLDDA